MCEESTVPNDTVRRSVNVDQFRDSCFCSWETHQWCRYACQLFRSTPDTVNFSTKVIILTSFSITLKVSKVDESWTVFLPSKEFVASSITVWLVPLRVAVVLWVPNLRHAPHVFGFVRVTAVNNFRKQEVDGCCAWHKRTNATGQR